MDEKPKKKPWKEMTYAEKRARSTFLKAERAARKLEAETRWKELVAPHARFLEEEYGFHFASVEHRFWDAVNAYYVSLGLQVIFTQWNDADSVDVRFTRLINGTIPPILSPWNGFSIGVILRERAPEELAKLQAIEGLDHDSLIRGLEAHAAALRTYCVDILQGDFSFFDK